MAAKYFIKSIYLSIYLSRIETLFSYFNTTVAINTQYIVIVFVLKLLFPRVLSTIRNIIVLHG
jgi:hypothetical protein